MPLTDDGRERLAAEIEQAPDVLEQPLLVWVLDREQFVELRADLHAWRPGRTGPRQALIVRHEYPLRDVVEWVCEPFVRRRHE